MTFFDYDRAPNPIRTDIAPAYRAYWETLARPGSWWSGAVNLGAWPSRRSRATLAPAGVGERVASRRSATTRASGRSRREP